MWLLNQFHDCVRREVVPAIHADLGGHAMEVIAAGASIGAFNAVAVLCRYPDVFGAAIGMSGTYRIERFYDAPWSQDLYFAAPLQFLPGLEGPQLDLLRQRFAILASGEGAWEDIGESWQMAAALGAKGDPEPGGQLGPGVGARLAHLAPDAAAVPRRADLTRRFQPLVDRIANHDRGFGCFRSSTWRCSFVRAILGLGKGTARIAGTTPVRRAARRRPVPRRPSGTGFLAAHSR